MMVVCIHINASNKQKPENTFSLIKQYKWQLTGEIMIWFSVEFVNMNNLSEWKLTWNTKKQII